MDHTQALIESLQFQVKLQNEIISMLKAELEVLKLPKLTISTHNISPYPWSTTNPYPFIPNPINPVYPFYSSTPFIEPYGPNVKVFTGGNLSEDLPSSDIRNTPNQCASQLEVPPLTGE